MVETTAHQSRPIDEGESRQSPTSSTKLMDLFVPPTPTPQASHALSQTTEQAFHYSRGVTFKAPEQPLIPSRSPSRTVPNGSDTLTQLFHTTPATTDPITTTSTTTNNNTRDLSNETTSLLWQSDGRSTSPPRQTTLLNGVIDLTLHFGTTTPKTGARHRAPLERLGIAGLPELPSIHETAPPQHNPPGGVSSLSSSSLLPPGTNTLNGRRRTPNCVQRWMEPESIQQLKDALRYTMTEVMSPSTWIGAFMFLLFSLVFSLTFGATITRPHGQTPLLGLVSRMSALGIMMGAPIYWLTLRDIPALYPTVDLFVAPFLAKIAAVIDEALFQDDSVSESESDTIFLATFSFLVSVSLVLSGSLTVLASVFKVVDLGAFLPFPVLCGFFTAAGCLTWTLAFKVDTNGLTVAQVFGSGDRDLIFVSLLHHAPSIVVAAIMKYMGPKHPLYVVMSVLCTIASFYMYMFIFGISMDEMIQSNWFWSTSDLHFRPNGEQRWAYDWATPSPFGWIHTLIGGHVHWGAVTECLETTVALSFLYLIRCSLHSTALKKNVAMLSRIEKVKVEPIRPLGLVRDASDRSTSYSSFHRRRFSEVIDVESEHADPASAMGAMAVTVVTAKPSHSSLKHILLQYGHSQLVCSLVGGFGIIPCVATAPTMFMLGAEKLAPQIGSVLLISVFYFTDYQLAGFIPKPAFSSLLVLSFIDVVSTWFVKSYYKTEEKLEWLVVPLIVVLAFVVGLLQAVLLGLSMSTFLFVAAFFRSGVVKYAASGVNVRSTIERPPKVSRWLDETAEQIQILVMQNFLFFGNASSFNSYIVGMFAEADGDIDPLFITPCPKIIIVDLTLVTGMDTSAVDAFSDILTVCRNNSCKLFLSGVSPRLQRVMSLCGIKPDSNSDRSKRSLRFFSGLDAALGKAEDMLIELEQFEENDMEPSQHGDGFLRSLYHIDQQHGTSFAYELRELQAHTRPVTVEPGDCLYQDHNLDGLFFIEHGVLKIERSSDATLSRVGSEIKFRRTLQSVNSLESIRVSDFSRWARSTKDLEKLPRFRIARVGPGWVIGSLEAISETTKPESIIAVTSCHLHYISYQTVQEIEASNPRLVLQLYKLLSSLMTKRQQVTIAQLGTLHSIMSAPALKKPHSRSKVDSFYG